MGFWPLDLTFGGIAWGAHPPDVEAHPDNNDENDLMWGDSMADIVDRWLDGPLREVYDQCDEIFVDSVGRPMDPREFLCGLAFGLNAIERTAGWSGKRLGELMKEDLPFTLSVKVVPVEEEDEEE